MLFAAIVVLYAATPVCMMRALGAMVSKKYEVDESYWKLAGNHRLTAARKADETKELDQKGRKLAYEAGVFALLSLVAFAGATGLLLERDRIIGRIKSST